MSDEQLINYVIEEMKEIKKELIKARLDIQSLKVKSKLWGAVTGSIASALVSLLTVYLQTKK